MSNPPSEGRKPPSKNINPYRKPVQLPPHQSFAPGFNPGAQEEGVETAIPASAYNSEAASVATQSHSSRPPSRPSREDKSGLLFYKLKAYL